MINVPNETEAAAPPYWRLLYAGDRVSATIVCPNGHRGSLLDHTIGQDGEVTPSAVCPVENCTWHEWIRLDGWASRRHA